MTDQKNRRSESRALVLGGGGVTGIAWEVGVLSGLLGAGLDLSKADAVIGTSAGSFVGAALAGGQDMDKLFAGQLEPGDGEIPAAASEETTAAWIAAFEAGGGDRWKVGIALGEIARANPEPIPLARRRAVVEGRLLTRDWPATLRVTAIDADNGELRVFEKATGVPLVDAVSASGAVPGVWPPERIGGRTWIDGGMVSTANARLAEGYDRVVIVAPMPAGHGEIPGAAEDAAAMSARAAVRLIVPDEQSVAAIGPNPYDPDRRGPAALAGRAQGAALADAVAAMW